MVKSAFSGIFVLLICALVSIPMAVNGIWEDSAVYYEQAQFLWENGLFQGLKYVTNSTGKHEVLYLVFLWLQGFLPLFFQQEFGFVVLNMMAMNFTVVSICNRFSAGRFSQRAYFYMFFAGFVVMSYYVYSNTFYIWRSVFAFYFIACFITTSSTYKKIIFFIMAFFFHYTAVLFILLWYISEYGRKISLNNRFLFFLLSIVIGLSGFFLMSLAYKILSYFVVSFSSFEFDFSLSNILKRLLVNGYLVLVLFSIRDLSNFKYPSVWYFCLFCLVLSTIFFLNWQISWRLAAPAMLYSISLICSVQGMTKAKLLIYLSILPGLRIIYLLLTHQLTSL